MQTYNAIIENLTSLNPSYIELNNESMNHSGFFEGKESHFKLTIVSPEFESLRPVARHQKIYGLVNNLMTSQGGSVHALAIHAYTPQEWATANNTNQAVPDSPLCASQKKL